MINKISARSLTLLIFAVGFVFNSHLTHWHWPGPIPVSIQPCRYVTNQPTNDQPTNDISHTAHRNICTVYMACQHNKTRRHCSLQHDRQLLTCAQSTATMTAWEFMNEICLDMKNSIVSDQRRWQLLRA